LHFQVSEIKELTDKLWKKGFIHLLSANILTLIFGFASQLFVAWILPAEDIGRIKILQTYIGIFSIAAGLGFSVSVLKLCSENRPAGEIQFLYKRAIRYSIVSVLATYVIIVLLSLAGVISPDKAINRYMILFSVSLLPLTISSVYMSYLQAKQKIRLYSNIQIMTKLFSIIVIIILTYFYKLEGFIIAIIVGYFLTNLFLNWFIRNRINKGIAQVIMDNPLTLHWKYARYSLGASITDSIGLGIDILLLNYLVSDMTAIGYYSFAITIIGVFRILPATIWTMAAPHFSGKMDDSDNWFATYKKYNRILVVVSLVITVVSALAIPFILRFFLNGKFEQSGIFFILLVIAWGIRNLFVIKASVLFGMGKINLNFYSSFVYLAASAVSIPVLIHFFGVTGAGIGVILSTIIGLISVEFFFSRVRPVKILVNK